MAFRWTFSYLIAQIIKRRDGRRSGGRYRETFLLLAEMRLYSAGLWLLVFGRFDLWSTGLTFGQVEASKRLLFASVQLNLLKTGRIRERVLEKRKSVAIIVG